MARNDRLQAMLRKAGFVLSDGSIGLKEVARAVQRVAAQHGVDKPYTHTYVTRWLNGTVPRDEPTRRFITVAVAKRLGRPVTDDEVGFTKPQSISAEVGLAYPAGSADGIAVVSQLLDADREGLPAIVATDVHVSGWSEAALSWLVRQSTIGSARAANVRIGSADLHRIKTTTEAFARLDNQFGGGHARRALIEFLHGDLAPRLRTVRGDTASTALFAVAADCIRTAAWMAYDAGVHGLAQRYFISALRLAQDAGAPLLAGGILDAMSHQATFLGRFSEAVNLAGAALAGTTAAASPTFKAHFHAMQARAYARLGDVSATDRAMSEARREFEHRNPDAEPSGFEYFDEAEFTAELGHCNRDLGRAVDASTYASVSLGNANGEYLRSDFFATMVLADAYLDQGEAEEGCRVALQALDLAQQLKSARCSAYVEEFRQRLNRFRSSAAAKAFTEQAACKPLWHPDQ